MWKEFEMILSNPECSQKFTEGHTLISCSCDTTVLDDYFPMIEFGLGDGARMRVMPSDYMMYEGKKGPTI